MLNVIFSLKKKLSEGSGIGEKKGIGDWKLSFSSVHQPKAPKGVCSQAI